MEVWALWGRGLLEVWALWGRGHLEVWALWDRGPLEVWALWGRGPFELSNLGYFYRIHRHGGVPPRCLCMASM